MTTPECHWQRWYDAHEAQLLLYARQWLPERADAEDAVQAGFVRFWRARPTPDAADLPLLFTAVRTAALDLAKSRRRRVGREQRAAGDTASDRTVMEPTEPPAEEQMDRKQAALDLVMETIEALFAERGSEEKIWGSMVKQALKRRKPGFNESYYGFRSFGKLLDEAAARKLLDLEEDEKSGGVIIRGFSSDW